MALEKAKTKDLPTATALVLTMADMVQHQFADGWFNALTVLKD